MRRDTPVLATLVTVLALSLAGCGLLGGEGNVFELAVGDCFDNAADSEAAGTSGEVSEVPIVDCAEPHDNEVFHSFELDDGDFPGEEALLERAEAECLPAFAEFVGTEYADSRLDIFPITPTSGSWEDGDREVVCVLFDVELEQLEGSMQGSGV